MTQDEISESVNVLDGPLKPCAYDPITGFFRNGRCDTGPSDRGRHTVCVRVTAEFLAFSRARGNDLATPRPEFGFTGLRPGDRWCLCADRWKEAWLAGVAPKVVLASTHKATLRSVPLEALMDHALPGRDDERH
ncbi:DUF2237 domain-containing protein [Amaricoccus sp.]|uniref:DUF2237 family protein n=1 Tax=Amaricoccus sp. TaxID=1872485 RepID=UPI0026295E27|nr:DUF2237 domain-containing protein [uncultured Amaricoccus sp.]